MVEELYTEYRGRLLDYCRTLTPDRAGAEDLVQETFLRALAHLDQLEDMEEGQRRAWLRRTARNLFIDRCRAASHEAALTDEVEAVLATEEDFSAAAVGQLVDRLPPDERQLFSLRYFAGYNATELGELFSLPPATVRSRLSAARRKLKQWIQS